MTPKTLDQLREHGVTAETKLPLEYFFFTDGQSKAASLSDALAAMGYSPEFGPSASDKRIFVVNGWTPEMEMSDNTVSEWTELMCKLGCEHDCEFDGWGTHPPGANEGDA
jgi:hypothetical protein